MSSIANRPRSNGHILDSRYQQAIEFLYSRINYERTPDLAKSTKSFRLERMQALLSRLGDPQAAVPCVHVAGSKGKGSTATMVARILEESGTRRVGLFTSPHAHQFEERFTINQQLPELEELLPIVQRLQAVTAEMDAERLGGPTFFELATAAGWLHFQQRQVEVAVIEVGLGGRLDSTNVCQPLACVITSISRDHTRLLGETLELIAREKAGIIKRGIPVMSGILDPGSASVIQSVARDVGAPLLELGQDFTTHPQPPCAGADNRIQPWSFDYQDSKCTLPNLSLAMPGEHQTRNAALAIAVIGQLRTAGFQVSDEAIRRGLATAKIPLRIEVVSQAPLLVIDSAHNPASIHALCDTLHNTAKNKVCVFASSKDKETSELLKILDGCFERFILTAYLENPRAVPIEELSLMAAQTLTHPWSIAPTPGAAMTLALESIQSDEMICVTGSFFLAAEVQAWWQDRQLRNS